MRDKMSRKLRSIRGNVDKFEKSRNRVNKPMVLQVRDKATKQMNKVNKAIKKLPQSQTITMTVVDNVTKPTEKINRYFRKKFPKTHSLTISVNDKASKSMKSINDYVKRRMPKTHEIVMRARDRSRSVLEGINRYLGRNILGLHVFEIMARDRAMPTMHKIANYGKRMLSKGYNFSIRAIDIATKTVGRIASFTKSAIPKYRDFTIRAIDSASRVIGTVKRALFSIPTMITVGLAVVGVGSLGSATLGSAMDFEGYEVAMTHWLDGNQKKADDLIKWMGQFADTTPFSSADLFPALSRGIGVADGDIKQAQQLLEISSNMAALSPGKTVGDAMEALADVRMGEFERMKEFNMKITQDDYENAGWTGIVSEIDGTFKDGAKKFSQTASGQISTIKGYASTMFREAGTGVLTSMQPRLNEITKWLENNQDTWGEWKNTVQQAGEDAANWVFTKLEGAFSYLRDNYLENDKFKNLDFEGKVRFIMDDLGSWWDKTGRPLLADVSKDVGTAIFNGVAWGIKEGIKSIGSMWIDAFKDPSVDSFAGAGIATAIGMSIASLVLTPLAKMIGEFYKTGKWFWDRGKNVADLFGKGKDAKGPIPPIAGTSQPKTPNGPIGNTENGKPVYTQPWFDKGKPTTPNLPNQGRYSEPKGPSMMSKIGGGLKNVGKHTKIPIIGTALGAISLAGADKSEMPGILGGMGGGLAGASTGAAVGSIVPGIGTAIGGIVGGVLGSFGGEAVTTWTSDNWEGIKDSVSKASSWRPGYSQAEDGSWVSPEFYGGEPVAFDKMMGGLEEARDKIGLTLFNSSWWSGKWDDTKSWASDKWSNATDLWDSATEQISSTLFSGDWWGNKWSSVKKWAGEKLGPLNEAWEGVKKGASNTLFSGEWWNGRWESIKFIMENALFNPSYWAEKAGFIFGILESTLFSGEWWSGHWETVKGWTEGTIFSGDWWSEKWESVKGWTQEKWDSAVSVWESIKTKVAETVFSPDWWGEKWEGVKAWTQEKWDGAQEIWNSITSKINETVFNPEWWGEHWETVKGWTQEKWNEAQVIWDSITTRVNETVFNGDWWLGHWESVKGWTQEKWDSAQVVWDSVTSKISETVFNSEWWKGHWESVKAWTQEKWNEAQAIWDSIQKSVEGTVFDGAWWKEKWGNVTEWTSETWEGAKDIWEDVKKGLSESLFDGDWWNEKWNGALEAGKGILGGIGGWVSGLIEDTKESFQKGRARGKEAAGPPELARGTNFHKGGPAILGDGGGSELIRYPNGSLALSPSTDTLMNLPRGTQVLPHRETKELINSGIPAYANGVGFKGSQDGRVTATTIRPTSEQDSPGNTVLQLQGINHSINNVPIELGNSTRTIANSLLGIKESINNGITNASRSISDYLSKINSTISGESSRVNDSINNGTSGLKDHITSSNEKISNSISGLKEYLSNKISKVEQKAEQALQTANSAKKSSASSGNSLEDRIASLIKQRGSTAEKYFAEIKVDGDWLNDWSHTGDKKVDKPYLLAGFDYAKQLGFDPGSGKGLKHLNRIKGYAKGTNGPLNRSETAWVGERGPELVSLPKGAEVFTNQDSKRMASGNSGVGNIEKQGQSIGKTFAESVGEGINNKVISMENWKQQNIQQPMNSVVKEAVGFGSGTVSSFAAGQNAMTTNTGSYLDRQVKAPFSVIEGGASKWGTGTISGFRSGQDSIPTNTKSHLDNQVKAPFEVIKGTANKWGTGTVAGFRSGQDATQTGTKPYLATNVHIPFDETKEKGSVWGSGTASEFVSGMRSESSNVREAAKYLAEQVEKTFKEELGIKSPSRVMMKLGEFASIGIVKGLGKVDVKKFAEGQAGSLAAAFTNMGAVGGNVQSWLKAAMAITGTPSSWLGALSTIAMKESGGRTGPGTINKWDSNWTRGTPSMGLMQTIRPTFESFKGKGLNDIMNPIHNAVASINYIKSRYGTVYNTPGIRSMMSGGPYKGYYKGTNGPLRSAETAWVGERGPELVRLPRGAEVYSNQESMDMVSGGSTLPPEQMASVVHRPRKEKQTKRKSQDVNVNISGEYHFHNDMDVDEFGRRVVEAVEKALEDEYFEGGEMAVYG